MPKKLIVKPVATLEIKNGRAVISNRHWNAPLIADYMLKQRVRRWFEIGELARVAYGFNYPWSQRLARKGVTKLFNELLNRGFLLVVKTGIRLQALAVKIYDPLTTDIIERKLFGAQIERKRQRREVSEDQYRRIMDLLQPAPLPAFMT
jgi:hypothetical protein